MGGFSQEVIQHSLIKRLNTRLQDLDHQKNRLTLAIAISSSIFNCCRDFLLCVERMDKRTVRQRSHARSKKLYRELTRKKCSQIFESDRVSFHGEFAAESVSAWKFIAWYRNNTTHMSVGDDASISIVERNGSARGFKLSGSVSEKDRTHLLMEADRRGICEYTDVLATLVVGAMEADRPALAADSLRLENDLDRIP